ncbi:hypothetical protein [Planococcus sp. YIM B11945]|uniref:hypothetical protein n=1 Tax=Planococcus sp. YIM B11945 TaxID=3435410 RepID=UPI003D7E8BEF
MNQGQHIPIDESGIRSLSGFAYQIRVFVYYMSKMKTGGQVEFETLEDIVFKDKIDSSFLDSKSELFNSFYQDKVECYHAIQVKRTTVSNATRNKILFNWILLEYSAVRNIEKFILFTDDKYKNSNTLFDISCQELFDLVVKSSKKSSALISKVKLQFENKYEEFERIFNKIYSKHEFISEKSLNEKIINGFDVIFRKEGVSDLIYQLRVKELIQYIQGEIMSAIYAGNSYSIKHKQMVQKIEEIGERISEKVFEPDYTAFRKTRQLDLKDSLILNSREYLQLEKCNLNQKRMEEHLIYQQYYENIKDRFLEDNKLNQVNNIERTTYDNFCSVKEELEVEQKDFPIKRLSETKKMNNAYVQVDQTRFGSCIYLTRDDTDIDLKISWEDES